MAKLLVAGGLDHDAPPGSPRERFAAALGHNIVSRGHTLLGACRTSLDSAVALAASDAATQKGLDPRRFIRSWVTTNTTPSHGCGELVRSQLHNWDTVPRGYVFPEPIQDADAVIIVGGWDGTHYAASWTRIAGKPLLPVASFGGAAEEIFKEELRLFDRRVNNRVSAEDFQILNRVLPGQPDMATIEAYAGDVLKLAERAILSSDVFVVMSFADKPHLRDAYNTMQRVCKEKNLVAAKVDQHLDGKSRIVETIFTKIKSSAFLIVDVSDARPNVYYELGYAHALGKPVIQTAYDGTPLHFDVYDVPTHYWDSQEALETKLKAAIDQLAKLPGQYS